MVPRFASTSAPRAVIGRAPSDGNMTGGPSLAGAASAPPNATAPFAAQAGMPPVIPAFPFFTPSFDLALAATVILSALSIVHVYLTIRTKAYYFGPLMSQAGIIFTVAMILRIVVITTTTVVSGPFIVSAALLSVPSVLIGIALIFTYTRVVWWITPDKYLNASTLWLPPRFTSVILGVLQGISDGIVNLGSGHIVKPAPPRLSAIGAVLEMLTWMLLGLLVFRFTIISRRWPMEREVRERSWQLQLALVACTVLLSIRGVFQVLEKDALTTLTTISTPGSIVTTEEWPTYVFSFLPNLLIIMILSEFHPGHYLPPRLTGFRLRTAALARGERPWALRGDGPTPASNGWTISEPTLIEDFGKGDVLATTTISEQGHRGLPTLYEKTYAWEDERARYLSTLTGVGRAR